MLYIDSAVGLFIPLFHLQYLIYLIPIKIRAPLNLAPLLFAPLIFAHPQISRPFIFRAPLFYCKFAVFHSLVAFFLHPLIFAHSYCANLLPLIFAQARCAKIKGARILMGIRYLHQRFYEKSLFTNTDN